MNGPGAERSHWQQWGALALCAAVITGVFVFSAITGAIAAYVAMLAVLFGIVVVWRPALLGPALRDSGARLFLLAFALLALAFGLSARQSGDLAAVGDFAILPLAVVGLALMRRTANPRGALIIGVMAWAGALVTVIDGVFEVYVFGVGRARGGFNSMYYSEVGTMLGFIALAGIFAPGPRWRWLLASGPVLSLACAQLGGSRGALLAIAVLLVTFIAIAMLRWPRHWHRIALGCAATLGLLGLAASLVFDLSRLAEVPALIQQAVTTGTTTDASANLRLEFYSSGLRALADSPIYGHGWWRRFLAAEPYMNADALAFTGPLAHLHNDIINFGSAAGALGILAYLLMIIAPPVSAWHSPRDSQFAFRMLATTLLSLGIFVLGFSDALFIIEITKTFYILGAVTILGFCRDAPLPARA